MLSNEVKKLVHLFGKHSLILFLLLDLHLNNAFALRLLVLSLALLSLCVINHLKVSHLLDCLGAEILGYACVRPDASAEQSMKDFLLVIVPSFPVPVLVDYFQHLLVFHTEHLPRSQLLVQLLNHLQVGLSVLISRFFPKLLIACNQQVLQL